MSEEQNNVKSCWICLCSEIEDGNTAEACSL
jgi:hypothetical protein